MLRQRIDEAHEWMNEWDPPFHIYDTLSIGTAWRYSGQNEGNFKSDV